MEQAFTPDRVDLDTILKAAFVDRVSKSQLIGTFRKNSGFRKYYLEGCIDHLIQSGELTEDYSGVLVPIVPTPPKALPKAKFWGSMVNLSGLYSLRPLKMVPCWGETVFGTRRVEWWGDKGSFTAYKEGLCHSGGLTTFVSQSKIDVSNFISGVVLSMQAAYGAVQYDSPKGTTDPLDCGRLASKAYIKDAFPYLQG